jgi:hypothetical protein
MQNSSSLTELLSRLLRLIRGRSGAVRARQICANSSKKNSGDLAPDNVGTPIAELISGSNHFLCCGSAIHLAPHDHTVPSNGHADFIWSQSERWLIA